MEYGSKKLSTIFDKKKLAFKIYLIELIELYLFFDVEYFLKILIDILLYKYNNSNKHVFKKINKLYVFCMCSLYVLSN